MDEFKELVKVKNKLLMEQQFSKKVELNKRYNELRKELDIRVAKETFTYKDYEVLMSWAIYYKGEKVGYMLDYFNKQKKIRSVGVEI